MRKNLFLLAALAIALRAQTALPVLITVNTSYPGEAIPRDFLGLSFETGSLTSATAFPAENPRFQNMVSQLGAGWLRFGGNSVDKTAWARGQRTANSPTTTLFSSDVDRVMTFARATGWRVLWALNLASSNPGTAADESDYVMQTGSDVLSGFEIGNEPDLYTGNTLVNFQNNWKTFADAIQARNSGAVLTGPADAGNISTWTGPFTNTFHSRLAMVTQHFYPLGPPPTVPASQPNSASIPNLLSANTRGTADSASLAVETIGNAQKPALPWRMAETNSCYNGGYDGVSNVFASALWGMDYMLTLAGRGASGLNFHGGGSGLYTPIATSVNGGTVTVSPRPLYYAMLMFTAALGSRPIPATVNSGRANATGYALLDTSGALRVVIINKDSQFDASVQITAGSAFTQAAAIRLSAPSLSEKTAITLAGAAVAADGSWTPQAAENVPGSKGVFSLTVPAGSAAMVGFGDTKAGIGNTAGGKALVAPVSMASLYGTNLAFFTRSTPTVDLPSTLAGASLTVTDSAGVSRPAPLIYVSPSQINFVIPAGTAPGTATVTSGAASGTVQVANAAPGIFTVGGTNTAAATVTDGVVTLYGTGIRGGGNVSATVGGVNATVLYAGAQGQYPAFDQVNLQLPGGVLGTVDVVLMVDGQAANTVQVTLPAN